MLQSMLSKIKQIKKRKHRQGYWEVIKGNIAHDEIKSSSDSLLFRENDFGVINVSPAWKKSEKVCLNDD